MELTSVPARREVTPVYPNAGHGFLYQYAVKFGTEVNTFLDR